MRHVATIPSLDREGIAHWLIVAGHDVRDDAFASAIMKEGAGRAIWLRRADAVLALIDEYHPVGAGSDALARLRRYKEPSA